MTPDTTRLITGRTTRVYWNSTENPRRSMVSTLRLAVPVGVAIVLLSGFGTQGITGILLFAPFIIGFFTVLLHRRQGPQRYGMCIVAACLSALLSLALPVGISVVVAVWEVLPQSLAPETILGLLAYPSLFLLVVIPPSLVCAALGGSLAYLLWRGHTQRDDYRYGAR